jgi:predicted ATPase/class 3 adenylate cyclase
VRQDLPTGTVTLLFTDIEGSTRLLDDLGPDRYGELLAQHHAVCRSAWAAHGGGEVDTAGDAFFVAFATASDALLAAQKAQAGLAELGLRVRMGVHTGEVSLGETGYIGLEVHRSARIASAAHGGQVLVSAAAAAVLGPASNRIELRDLGEHRFKDLAAPERVFQVGSADFPPIRSLYGSNLPVPGTAFVGRRGELAEVIALLARDGVRLMTLTGPGGTGKTRLALQAAAEVWEAFPDGVWWLPLASLRDTTALRPALAHVLDVKEPGGDFLAALSRRLSGKRVLLVLDNAEHLLPALAHELNLLRTAMPTIALLVTSRERLQLAGEEIWLVPPLAEPEGVELLRSRARSLGADFDDGPAVRELCARLDGLPLALELAAARAVVFSPEQLLQRLGQRLDLLKGGRDADPRQQTLRATIDWSYQLLSESERRVFRALSVFAGGCTYEAAEDVAGADPDGLQSLLDKSLLRRSDGDHGPRYSLLETIREYAADRLSHAVEESAVWDRFDGFAAKLIEELGEAYFSSGMRTALARYAEEHANVWLAIARADSSPEALARAVVGLHSIWTDHGDFAAPRALVDGVIERLEELSPPLQARFLVAAGVTLVNGGDVRGTAFARRAVAMLESSDDMLWLGRALCCAGAGERHPADSGPSAKARRLLARAVEVSRAAGDEVYLGVELVNLAEIAGHDGDSEWAMSLAREAASIGERLDHDMIRDQALLAQASLARGRGELDLCEQLVRQALGSERPRRWTPDPVSLVGLIELLIGVSAARGDAAVAACLAGALEASTRAAGFADGYIDGLDIHIAGLREQGPADLVDRALDQGRAMSTDDLVEYALGARGEPDGGS